MCYREVFPGEFGLLLSFEVGRFGKVGAAWRRPCGWLGVALQLMVSSELVSTGTCCLASCRSHHWNSLLVRWRQILNLWVVIRECIYWPIFMSDLCSSWRHRCQRGPRGCRRGRGHVISAFILLTAVYLCLFAALLSTVYLNTCDGLNMSAAMRSCTAARGWVTHAGSAIRDLFNQPVDYFTLQIACDQFDMR